jgi:outer membrane protein TolC
MKINFIARAALMLLVTNLVVFAKVSFAGSLTDGLEARMSLVDDESAASLQNQAMLSRYKAARSALYPHVSVAGVEARRNQSVTAPEASFIRSGSNSFDNTRFAAIIKQPLFDREIFGQIDEAKSFGKYADIKLQLERNDIGSTFLSAYMDVAKNNELLKSFDLMILEVEQEIESATKKIELNLITSGEFNTIKLHLLNLRKNRDLVWKTRDRANSRLGSISMDTQSNLVMMSDSASLSSLIAPSEGLFLSDNDQSASLKSDIALLSARAKSERAKRLPKISLVGLYEYDDAAETLFGGPNRIEDYEVGVVFEWTLFSGGYSKHKLREIEFLKKAKEARLSSALGVMAGDSSLSSNRYRDSLSNLKLENDMVDYRYEVSMAMKKGFEVGTEDYLSTMNSSLLLSESQRSMIASKYLVLDAFINMHLTAGTLFSHAVAQLDSLFEEG